MGTLFGPDISTELSTGTKTVILAPSYDDALVQEHKDKQDKIKERLERLKKALVIEAAALDKEAKAGNTAAGT